MKKTIKLYLDEEDIKALKRKVEAAGFTGRGSLNRYLEKIAREDIAFLDSNVKAILAALQLQSK